MLKVNPENKLRAYIISNYCGALMKCMGDAPISDPLSSILILGPVAESCDCFQWLEVRGVLSLLTETLNSPQQIRGKSSTHFGPRNALGKKYL